MITRLIKTINRICSIGAIMGGIVMLFIMLLTIATVVFRTLGTSIVGSYEVTELVIVFAVIFALVYCTMTDSNVSVEVFVKNIRPSIKRKLHIFHLLLSFCFWGLMAWEVFKMSIEKVRDRTEVFILPLLPFRLIWAIGLTILVLGILAKLVEPYFRRENKK